MPVTVQGGGKLARFVERVTDPQFEIRIFTKVLRNFIVPELRRHAPVRTGKLRRSIRVIQRGGGVEIRGQFYGQLVRFRSPVSGQIVNMPGLTIEVILRNKARIVAEYRAAVQAAIG